MGTLLDQPVRNLNQVNTNDVDEFLREAIALSNKYDIGLSQVLTAFEIKELKRKNDLFVANGNIFDEQMAGIGGILADISITLSEYE